MGTQPNFLFMITDQHRANWLGCYGHPVVKTPNIDAIAEQGTRFENFYVASPICMPNRASLMTGRMPSVHGLRYNGCLLPINAHTFIDVLTHAGYDTATIGKSHLQPMIDAPAWNLNGDSDRIIKEAWQPMAGDYDHESTYRYTTDSRYEIKTPYYGFNHVDMVTDHGDKCGGHYLQWFRENAPNWQDLHDEKNEIPHNYSCQQAYRTPIPEHLYPTSWVANRAIEYLQAENRHETPFFAFVSFPDPHHPFNPPGKYWDMYSPGMFDVDLPFSAHKNPIPPMQWLEDNFRGSGYQETQQTAIRVSDQEVKEMKALTAGMITCVDDAIGRIMASLHSSGLFDNTIVCFNSDHGDYLGDFNLAFKGLLPFRSITQVPMIWSDPANREQKIVQSLASTIDISATILDRAGLVPYFGMQGQSFLETIMSGCTHREELLIEFNDGAPKFGFDLPARVRSLLDDRWRYTLYAQQPWGELYDLSKDPRETCNLWDNPEYSEVRAHLAERLCHHLTTQMDESPRAIRRA